MNGLRNAERQSASSRHEVGSDRIEARVVRHGRLRAEVQTVRLARKLDRIFTVLLTVQWGAAVGLAFWLSPTTWDGPQSLIHPHVYAAALLGGIINLVPVGLALRFEGRPITRHTIAVAQIAWSIILIHLTGGRAETHFHIFCSLAFLAAYRDWTTLVLPTVITAVDHYARGRWWPESIYGVAAEAPWRWLEHVGWVLFEDAVLVWGCLRGAKELRSMAELTVREQAALRVAAAHSKAERDAALQADQAKSAFLANMSHEIRTPLNAILGFTDVLRSENCPPAERDEHLDTIRRSGDHLLALINDILDLSKVESGRMTFEQVECDPNAILAGVLSGMRVVAGEKGLTLEGRWRGPVPATIVTDPARLRQVLLNLVGNAVKFTSTGYVRLLAEVVPNPRGGGYLFGVDVFDSGEGIAPEKLKCVFEPFTQADVSVTRRHGGTGLGLSISRQIAEHLGGSIVAASRPDEGSLFRVTVDAGDLNGVHWEESRENEAPAEALGSDAGPSCVLPQPIRQNARILLVDDGDVNRRLIRVVLGRVGLTPDEATNGWDALQTALEAERAGRGYDLILLDMQMPVMDGYAAAGRMRDEGLTMPIVALTAHAMAGDRAKCVAAGCTEYLSKPVRPAGLLGMLGQLLPAASDAAAFAESATPTVANLDSDPQPALAVEPPVPAAEPAPLETFAEAEDEGPPPGCELPEEDSDLWPVAAEFVQSLPDRIEECRTLLESGDAAGLSDAAHKLAGTAGTLGYSRFTAPAAALEAAAEREWDEQSLLRLVLDLTDLTTSLNTPAQTAAAVEG